MNLRTLEEIEQALLNAPRPAKPAVDPAEEQRKRETFLRSLDEVEAALTGRVTR